MVWVSAAGSEAGGGGAADQVDDVGAVRVLLGQRVAVERQGDERRRRDQAIELCKQTDSVVMQVKHLQAAQRGPEARIRQFLDGIVREVLVRRVSAASTHSPALRTNLMRFEQLANGRMWRMAFPWRKSTSTARQARRCVTSSRRSSCWSITRDLGCAAKDIWI